MLHLTDPFALLLLLALFLLAAAGTWFMLQQAAVIDNPNKRSSHQRPTPKSGGAAIVVAMLAGYALLIWQIAGSAITSRYYLALLVASLLVAAISLYDDIHNKSFATKLIGQMVAALLLCFAGVWLNYLDFGGGWVLKFGGLGAAISFCWVVGLTNAYNFMDGLDGFASATAVIACLFFAVVCLLVGAPAGALLAAMLAATTAGFLVFNWPPAKIFMGDVGSGFIGFWLAGLALAASLESGSSTPLLAMVLLLFHDLFDTIFTMVRRWQNGDEITAAHRSHIYQLRQQLGWGHLPVTLTNGVVGLIQGGLVLGAVVAGQPWGWFAALLLLVAPYLLIARMMVKRAKVAGIL